jgi:hypothetical protein
MQRVTESVSIQRTSYFRKVRYEEVVIVHESHQRFGWKVNGTYIWWGSPRHGRHKLQYKRAPKPMRDKKYR